MTPVFLLATSSQTQTVTFTAVVSDNVTINTVRLPGTTLVVLMRELTYSTKLYDYDDFGFGNSSETLTLTVTDTAQIIVTEDISITISKVDDRIHLLVVLLPMIQLSNLLLHHKVKQLHLQ